MSEFVDPPVPAKAHPVMSEDLQKVLGDIQCGAEQWLEVLKDQKRKLQTGTQVEMKPVLGHIEMVEGKKVAKMEEEETETGDTGEPPFKHRVIQSIAALKEAKHKENISQQEQRWIELTQRWQGSGSTASASAGAPASSSTVTSTTLTTMLTVGSTVEAEQEVDLEEVMHSQADEEDDGYGKRYKTTSQDRMDRGAARAKQKEE